VDRVQLLVLELEMLKLQYFAGNVI